MRSNALIHPSYSVAKKAGEATKDFDAGKVRAAVSVVEGGRHAGQRSVASRIMAVEMVGGER